METISLTNGAIMNIYVKTEGMLITTNMCVNPEDLKEDKFKIQDVINHLRKYKQLITNNNCLYEDLIYVCNKALRDKADDCINYDNHAIVKNSPNVSAKSFFYPSCRIIRIDLTTAARATQGAARRISQLMLETGYDMSIKKGCHAAIIIKIERMTDSSCFASWSLVK